LNIITDVKARLFNVPLDEVLVDAKHGAHSHFHLITATLTLHDGRRATGYTYNGGRGGIATAAVITHDLADLLIGQDADDIAGLYHKMHEHLHYVGRGGIVSFAISAVDIALWDFRAKAANLPLWQVTGGANDRCKAYAGGIDLVDSLRQKSLFVGFPFDQLYATVLDAYRNIIPGFIRRPRTA
jgi:L-alanine-DL-glutamate epimerase-like enolase superfamily enzyme